MIAGQQAPPVANPPAQQPPVYTDDRHESPNLPNGYWALHRVILTYVHSMGTPDGGPMPSHNKARRVFELVAKDRLNSKEGLLHILQVIAENPNNNAILREADLIFADIRNKGIRDADLDEYSFFESWGCCIICYFFSSDGLILEREPPRDPRDSGSSAAQYKCMLKQATPRKCLRKVG